MSLAADAIHPATVQALFSLRGRVIASNLADALIASSRIGFDLDFDDEAKLIRIDFRDKVYLGSRLGGDAYRFAMATFVSVNDIVEGIEDRQRCAWSLIRLYYAAFYASHCLLRLLGQSCSYLDKSHTTGLLTIGAAGGNNPGFTVGRGLYYCIINDAQTGLTMSSINSASGGTHESFWKIYDDLSIALSNEVLRGPMPPTDAQEVFAKLSVFRSTLSSGGAGPSWLCAIRNNIQYRQGQGVWEPPSRKKKDRERLARLVMQCGGDPMNVDFDFAEARSLERFVSGCAFAVAFCKALISRIAERSSVGAASFACELLSLARLNDVVRA